jgi:DNA-binding NarL/FixJ family response regulator
VPSFGGGKILFSVWRPDPPDVGYGEQVMSQNLALAITRRVTELNDLETVRNMEGRLTKRQISCVGLISRGFSDQQIAELLQISAETVKEHVSEARLRLGVRRRTELVYKLTRAGLII